VGKSSVQKQTEQNQLQLQTLQMHQANQQAENQRQLLAQQQQIYGQISPFALSAIQQGQDAMNGNVSPSLLNALLVPQRNQLAQDFSQAGNNLAEALGQSGAYGSGIGAGPMANLFAQQARAQSDASANARLQGLQIGMQNGFNGANLLNNQQSVFNPIPYGALGNDSANNILRINPQQYAKANPLGGILGGITAAGLGGFTGSIGTGLAKSLFKTS